MGCDRPWGNATMILGGRKKVLERLASLESQVLAQSRTLDALRSEMESIQTENLSRLVGLAHEATLAIRSEIQGLKGFVASREDVASSLELGPTLLTRLEEIDRRLEQSIAEADASAAKLDLLDQRVSAVGAEVASKAAASASNITESRDQILADISGLKRTLDALPSGESPIVIPQQLIVTASAEGELVRSLDDLAAQVRASPDAVRKFIEDSADVQRSVASSSKQAILEVKQALAALMDEERKLSKGAQNAVAELNRATAEMEKNLTGAVDRHLGTVVLPKLVSLIDTLGKLTNRLEARGASPYKTAKSRILQYLLGKENVGGKHTPWERALECLVGQERDIGNQALKDLVREGLVLEKPTAGGSHVSLNQQRLKDIHRVINGEEV